MMKNKKAISVIFNNKDYQVIKKFISKKEKEYDIYLSKSSILNDAIGFCMTSKLSTLKVYADNLAGVIPKGTPLTKRIAIIMDDSTIQELEELRENRYLFKENTPLSEVIRTVSLCGFDILKEEYNV